MSARILLASLLSSVSAIACINPDLDVEESFDDGGVDPSTVAGGSAARGLIRQPGAVPGRYIVGLHPSRDRAVAGSVADRAALDVTVDRLAAAHAAGVGDRFALAIRGFTATMSEADARALATDPDVAFVEEEARVASTATVQDDATWGLDRIDQRALPLDTRYAQLADGTGVTAYVFDSGIRATHQEFVGRVLPGVTAINDGQGTNDCNQHGTHVSGTIGGTLHGVGKRISIVPVRVLGCDGGGTTGGIVAAIEWVIANRRPVSVANMSIAAPPSDTVDAAVRNLIAAGVTTIVSAGNNATDACLQSPARVAEAITVAATTSLDARASFSNFGTCVDLHAPGASILAASHTADDVSHVLSGTSMAAPHVTGVAALYLGAHPTASPAVVTQALLAGATPNVVTDVRGSPNRLLHTQFVDSTAPVVAISAPQANAEVAPSFMVDATASDPNLTTVALSIDGQVVETRDAPPFSFEVVDLAGGLHELTITGTDAAMHTSERSIEIQVTAPDAPAGEENAPEDELGGAIEGGCSAGGAPGLLVALAGFVLGWRRQRPRKSAATARRPLG